MSASPGGPAQVVARGLLRRYPNRSVLGGLDLAVGAGERLGVVGDNGSGKSTLLRLLAGTDWPSEGEVRVVGSLTHVAQTPEFAATDTVAGVIERALAPVRAVQTRLRQLELALAENPDDDGVLASYGRAMEELERRDGWRADARAATALAGVGLATIEPGRAAGTLSGGQRARLALAAVLVEAPDVILLDEPTNHLDDDALTFVRDQLRGHRGVAVVVSHDRVLLDEVATGTLDLDPVLQWRDGRPWVGPARFGGRYTTYLDERARVVARWARDHEAWNEEADRLRAAVRTDSRSVGHGARAPRDGDKFIGHFLGQRVDASVARRVRDAERRLAEHEAAPVLRPPRPLRLVAGLDADVPAGVLVSARDLTRPGRLAPVSLDLDRESRLLVSGANGAGKSTLLAALAGRLAVTGTLHHVPRLRIGWLPQEGTFPDPRRSPLELLAAGWGGAVQDHRARVLALGLLAPADLDRAVGDLSVGQRRRVALARVLAERPQLLLLDEPTNHLSLTLVEELEQALGSSAVPSVVVSHDRWLRRRWTGTELTLHAAVA